MRGVVLVDPKTSVDEGIPSRTSARGATGSRSWLDVTRIYAVQCACVTKSLMYDDDSPDGNPLLASRIFDASASLRRSVRR